MTHIQPARKSHASAAWLALLLLAGCREELAPERLPTTTVEGRLTVDGRPISSGWIEFHPAEGNVGNLRSAPIAPDGSYTADRVPLGRVSVGLSAVPVMPIVTTTGVRFLSEFRPYGTPIRREIPPGARTRLDLDLGVEARREPPMGRRPATDGAAAG